MEFLFQFDSFLDFMSMSGHGRFVWASYVITFLSLMLIAVIPAIKKKGVAKQVQRQQRILSNVKVDS